MHKNNNIYSERMRVMVGGICKDQYFRVNSPLLGRKNPISRDCWMLGGGAANGAVVHKSLASDKDIILLAMVGNDPDGNDLVGYMKGRGIKMPLKPVQDYETSFSYIYTDENSGMSTIFSARGARVAPIPLEQIEHFMPMAEALCLVAPCTNAQIGPILDIASVYNVPVYFCLGSMQINVLGYEGLANSLTHIVEMAICNRGEAQYLTRTSDVSRQLQAMQFEGKVRVAIITDGPRGIHALCDGQSYYVPAYTDGRTVLDDTGAGDSTAAAIVDAILRGEQLDVALLAGARMGFEVCTARGATTHLLDAEQMDMYIESVKAVAAVA